MKWVSDLLRAPAPRRNGAPEVPPGRRIYAVGDVHGRDDLLGDLLERIERDHAQRGPAKGTIIFLGDLIDRGPGSREAIERLRTYRREHLATAFLLGNHEEVLLRILDGDSTLVSDWLRFGGAQCIASYGADPAAIAAMPAPAAQREIAALVPPAHRHFLESFGDTIIAGDYLFVHAGIRPEVAMAQQTGADLRWIRAPFLEHHGQHEHVVVHGHTVTTEVVETPARIGIDTGAYRSGTLTAAVFEGPQRWFIQTAATTETG